LRAPNLLASRVQKPERQVQPSARVQPSIIWNDGVARLQHVVTRKGSQRDLFRKEAVHRHAKRVQVIIPLIALHEARVFEPVVRLQHRVFTE
jgi:hypothetical protein